MPKTVTLTDATLLNLAKNPQARQKVPILTAVFNAQNNRKLRRGCGSCAKRARLSSAVIATRTKLATTPAALQAIKKLLKADKLVMYVRGPRGLNQRREA